MATYWRVIRYKPTSGSSAQYLERADGLFFDFKVGNTLFDKDNLPKVVGFSNYFNSLPSSQTKGYRYVTPASVPFPVVAKNGSYSAYLTGFSMVYRRNSDSETDSVIEGVYLGSSTTISGKWRVKSGISSPVNYLIESTVNVKYTLQGTNYIAMVFPNNAYTDYGFKRTGALPTDVSKGSNCYNVGGYTEYPEFLADGTLSKTPDVVLFNDAFNSPNLTNIAGEIIDFGSFPQEVPVYYVNWLQSMADPIYPYTFTVKSQNGVNALASLEEAPAMVDATVSAVGNVKTLTMTGVNGQTYTMMWESETPAGKQFLGLAYGANETRASIPTGRTTPVTWDGSLTIYEAYGTYRPPVTTFDINLYQSSAEVNRVDKTDFLTGVGTLSGVLREECSIIAPSITFKQTTVPSFNYVYIAAFGRYYYVTGITSISKDIWRMSLSCDVLMTWKDDIRALTAIIARQENSFNPLLLDSELPAQANQNITVTEFPAGGFSTASASAYPFILTVVGA